MSRKSFWCKWSHILSSTTAICKWGLNQCLENLGNFRRKHVFCDPQMHCYWSLTFWISKILFDISFSLSPSPFHIFIYIFLHIYTQWILLLTNLVKTKFLNFWTSFSSWWNVVYQWWKVPEALFSTQNDPLSAKNTSHFHEFIIC